MLKIKYKMIFLVLSLLLAITILVGCSNRQNLENDKQKNNKLSEEKSISKIGNNTNKELIYSNLNSETSMNEIKSIFKDSGIENKSIDNVLFIVIFPLFNSKATILHSTSK